MSPPAKLLFVEDDDSGRELGAYNLRHAGYDVETAHDGARGIELFAADRHDLVITDLRMPRVPGMEVLRHVKSISPQTPVIVITAYGSIELAVQAMKLGAADYVGKPFNRDHLLLTVARALENSSLHREVTRLRVQASGVERPIIADSDAMDAVLGLADRLAPMPTHIAICGEPGTGRSLLARRIHVRSSTPTGPYVEVDCAALEPSRVDPLLFGDRREPGQIQRARGGTLVLRELTDLPPGAQTRLVRELESNDDTEGEATLRLIVTTRDDLDGAVAAKRLRQDLRYRIAAGEITIPPLRERPDDIEPLARFFVRQFAQGREPELDDAFVRELSSRPWHGNARELASACERAVALLAGDRLSADALPPPSPGPDASDLLDHWPVLPEEGIALFDLERRVIQRVLALKNWNVSKAAVFLHVPRHILAYRMEKYGIRRGG